MSVSTRAFCGVGLSFRSETEMGQWFVKNFKGTLAEDELTLINESIREFLDYSSRLDLPAFKTLNYYSDDEMAMAYAIRSQDPKAFHAAVGEAIESWNKHFKAPASVLVEVIYS